MPNRSRLLTASVVVALFVALSLAFAVSAEGGGPVDVTIYSSPTCSDCELFKSQMLVDLQDTFGENMVVTIVNVDETTGLAQLEAVEKRLNQPNNPLPVLQIGETLYANSDPFALMDAVAERIRKELADAAPESTAASSGAPTTAPTAAPRATVAATIHVAYVEKDGCEHCARASVALDVVGREWPNVVVTRLNEVRDADRVEAMGAHIGLPETQRLRAPSVYVGDEVLLDPDITTDSLRALFDRHADGAPAYWETLDVSAGESSIIKRFRTMGPFAVVLAGLIDGVNPCAFATILFFVSYLAISRRPRRDLLLIGLAFTAGVFLTYLIVGLGAMKLMELASRVRVLGKVLYGLMAASCLVLAGISLSDYVKARQGRAHEMSLNLSDAMRDRIKGRIRSASGAFMGAAFVSGLIVSVLELACTGQVYLPTISFVVGIPEMRPSAIAYLVLYNVMFIVPLLIVLLAAVYGVSAKRFQAWFVRNMASSKLIMALLFALLGALLITQVFGP